MLRQLVFSFLFIVLSNASFGQNVGVDSVVIQGKFQSKNIFVWSAYDGKVKGSAIQRIEVNGKVLSGTIESENFEIDLKGLSLKENDPIIIKMKYKKGYAPMILNPEAIK
jgi:hypothetical protein